MVAYPNLPAKPSPIYDYTPLNLVILYQSSKHHTMVRGLLCTEEKCEKDMTIEGAIMITTLVACCPTRFLGDVSSIVDNKTFSILAVVLAAFSAIVHSRGRSSQLIWAFPTVVSLKIGVFPRWAKVAWFGGSVIAIVAFRSSKCHIVRNRGEKHHRVAC